MTTLDPTPPRAREPETPADASRRPGAVHRLGEYATVRLVRRDPAPARVIVAGEIDLACADELAALLCAAVDAHPQGIDLDLASVSFCDCRGLRALLTTREFARCRGRHFALGPYSAMVARVLELAGARSVFIGGD